ncbi:MAG: hypothetical protein GYA21_19375 [Myxococcales bacterium]|nr:hypothetical protein [Myxococcales bacterium]
MMTQCMSFFGRHRQVLWLVPSVLVLAAACGNTGNRCADVDCDDKNPCTWDGCDPETGCLHTPQLGPCDDGNPCTDDTCHPTDGCGSVFNTAACDDQDPCTTGDTCQQGVCRGENVCACQQDADCEPFEDGDACNGRLACQETACKLDPATVITCDTSGDNDCRKNTCQPTTGTCQMENLQDGTVCDDGNLCTDRDRCQGGICVGRMIDCSDSNPCTNDDCHPMQGCVHTNNSDSCNDQNSCTSTDTCSGGACVGKESCCGDSRDNDGDQTTDCDDTDCSAAAECSGCPAVPDPEPVSESPLPGETIIGRSESTTVNGFHDDYLYNGAGEIKIGTRREWGGSIIFFGVKGSGLPGMNSFNTIDANDTGREVQVAFYDPDRAMQNCAWNASCATVPTQCQNSITYLGWNPVQGGNRCNRGSGVESVNNTDGLLIIATNPLFWNPNWDRTDCSTDACDDPNLRERRSDVRVVQRLRFVDYHVVELDYTVFNLSDLDHRYTQQEMPTVYTANGNNGPDLWRLFNSEGREIAIDQPANDGFYYKNFTSPGGFACMQSSSLDYGVGLYSENRNPNFQGWQLRTLPFNNFRPLNTFAIPAWGTVRARSYLMIGSLATINSVAAWLDSRLPPFGCLDAPTPEAVISGTVAVAGWALDNKGVGSVELVVDGTLRQALVYGGDRPDVCLVWPGYASCNRVGFGGQLDTSALTNCEHLLEIVARDTDGNSRVIARRRVRVAN